MIYKLAIVTMIACVSSVMGQAQSEFERKYDKSVSYVVSENILMTPEFTTDGLVCRMRLYPRHFSPNTNYIAAILPFKELMNTLNQLVPLPVRGRKKEPFDTGAAGGGAEWMSYDYEHITFSFVSSFPVDAWKSREEYVFTIDKYSPPAKPQQRDSSPTENDFSSIQLLRVEIVSIRWSGRQCASR